MKRAWLLVVAAAACSEPATLEPWQLDHDRIVAVRLAPPHVAPGELALFDALVAHEGGPTTVEPVVNATAPAAPGGLFSAVHFYIDHWQIDGPSQAQLDVARAELGLPAEAPVPIEVIVEVPGSLFAQKTVWLGDSRANPPAPAIVYGPTLARGMDHELAFDPPPGGSVRWLTSCGELRDADRPRAFHRVGEPCDGELVLVVRDGAGGVAWQTLPVHVE